MNRKLIHSKFCQTKTFKPGDDESFYTSVAFSVSDGLELKKLAIIGCVTL
jgi:hypothetical protein